MLRDSRDSYIPELGGELISFRWEIREIRAFVTCEIPSILFDYEDDQRGSPPARGVRRSGKVPLKAVRTVHIAVARRETGKGRASPVFILIRYSRTAQGNLELYCDVDRKQGFADDYLYTSDARIRILYLTLHMYESPKINSHHPLPRYLLVKVPAFSLEIRYSDENQFSTLCVPF